MNAKEPKALLDSDSASIDQEQRVEYIVQTAFLVAVCRIE